MSVTQAIPIIVDTDIGSDIDDAVCLSYLLRHPRCELVGITTVSGKPKERAALADAVCRGAGRLDMPVHAGVESALLGGVVQPDCSQSPALARVPHRAPETFESNSAVTWLRNTIRRRPGEITLLGIGPLMNIAALFASDPEIPGMLRSLVLMCGCFFEPRAYSIEWNARLDPTATAIVYNAPVADHASIGLDVTMQCKMASNVAKERFRELGGPLSVVAEMMDAKPHKPRDMVFHDPLAGVTIFEPGVCEWESGDVTTELLSRKVGGMTYLEKSSGSSRHRAAKTVNVEQFFTQYFSVF